MQRFSPPIRIQYIEPTKYGPRLGHREAANGRQAAGGGEMMNIIKGMTVASGLLLAASGFAVAAGVDELPPDIQKTLYSKDMLDPQQPVGPSAYRDWKAKKGPPWTIGYASSYAGNTWRAGVMDRLQNEIIPKWKKLGLLKDVIITQSNLKELSSDPADAPARRPGRRCSHRLLLESNRAKRQCQICLRQGRSCLLVCGLSHFALFHQLIEQLSTRWVPGRHCNVRAARR